MIHTDKNNTKYAAISVIGDLFIGYVLSYGFPYKKDLSDRFFISNFTDDFLTSRLGTLNTAIEAVGVTQAISDYKNEKVFGSSYEYIVPLENECIFVLIEEEFKIDRTESDTWFELYFLNYYLYLKSLKKEDQPQWIGEFVKNLKKYYPKKFKEYDSKPLLDLSKLYSQK